MAYFATQKISYYRVRDHGMEFLKEFGLVSKGDLFLGIMKFVLNSFRRQAI
jgi:hypothetical protein